MAKKKKRKLENPFVYQDFEISATVRKRLKSSFQLSKIDAILP